MVGRHGEYISLGKHTKNDSIRLTLSFYLRCGLILFENVGSQLCFRFLFSQNNISKNVAVHSQANSNVEYFYEPLPYEAIRQCKTRQPSHSCGRNHASRKEKSTALYVNVATLLRPDIIHHLFQS